MERLLIILAILVFVVAGVAVTVMAARGRREPLRMRSELDEEDEDLFIGKAAAPESPIDRTAQILDPRVLDPRVLDLEAIELQPIRALDRTERGEPKPPRHDSSGDGR